MPGCGSALALAASMTGSTDVGPIQPQQDSAPLLDDDLFDEAIRLHRRRRRSAPAEPRVSATARRKMSASMGSHQAVQLTPLWEYVVRTKKFPRDIDPATIFAEIAERLRDPEWEVRQHALRVLVDVLPCFGRDRVDELTALVLDELVDNLGNPAPAVRKGSLDALRIYLLHTPRRDEITEKILHDGMNRADVLDEHETSVATGVILSTPLLLFPSRSSTRPSAAVVREAVRALAMRLVQVTHQESALRSLAKVRDTIGDDEFNGYLMEVDDSMKRNFELLCDVYGVSRSSPIARRKRPRSRGGTGKQSADNKHGRRKDSVEESIKEVVAVDKSWESEEDSDTSGIAEEDEDTAPANISSARVVLETEIKFNEETAITMTILEEQEKEVQQGRGSEEDEDEAVGEIEQGGEGEVEERRKTPRRVHFGGEIVKLRTPDSEDAESVVSQPQQSAPVAATRTRIPLPVSPATRLPPQQPRRVRSSSQPGDTRRQQQRSKRRSASSSPRREIYVHDASLSPKKSILSKGSEFGDRQARSLETRQPTPRARTSRRDSFTPSPSPRAIIVESDTEPSFRVCEEPYMDHSPRLENAGNARSPSPHLLGEVVHHDRRNDIDSVFGDRSGMADFHEKIRKDHENMMRSVYRSKSAQEQNTKFDWEDERDGSSPGRERRRSQSAKVPGFEVFPRQERNYILMELSSPVKESSRRSSLQSSPVNENTRDDSIQIREITESSPNDEQSEKSDKQNNNEESNDNSEPPKSANEQNGDKKVDEPLVDSNKIVESENKVDDDKSVTECDNDDDVNDDQLGIIDDDLEKSALDAKERSSDSSSDSEWKNKEPSWEELGLVDEEVLSDFHNKDDWRARVRGLERIASALRSPSALEVIEPRLGSLLHAVLGGERSCRVAAAGMDAAKVVLTGVSEEALNSRLSLIAWGLARQGGPNAAHLARLTMLRTSPGLFLEKLLQPQCIGARNAKMRENTLQLLIFSLVTFPSTEFKVKSAIDKVVSMVGDRRKRVRHSALDTLAVLSQIYESEDILEASKRFTKGKQDGQTIHDAIKTRLSRKLLPIVSVDGLVVYGLQISSNSPHTGADVEWIVAGSGSVSPGTGRTRGQLIAMSKMENGANELNNKKSKNRPASEHSKASVTTGGLLEKNERTSSWKLLPQSDQNDKKNQETKLKKINRTSKSADLSKANNLEFEYNKEEIFEKESKTLKPYATPKRNDKKSESQISSDTKSEKVKSSEDNSNQIRVNNTAPTSKHESRIPIYTGERNIRSVGADMNGDSRDRSPADAMSHRLDYSDSNGYVSIHQKRKVQATKSAVPRTNHTINYGYANNFKQPQFEKPFEDMNAELQTKIKEDFKHSPLRDSKENNRTLSYEKLNKGFDTVIQNSRGGLRSVPHYQYSSKVTETYESIYQRQRRVKDERGSKTFEMAPGPPFYEYDGYKKSHAENGKHAKEAQMMNRSPQKRHMFFSPFDDRPPERPIELLNKEADQDTDNSSNADQQRVDSATVARTLSASRSTNLSELRSNSSPRHDAGEARSNSGSSSSSNRSVTARLRSRQTLPAHTESDESNGREDRRSRVSSPATRSVGKSFDVISRKSHPSRRNTPDILTFRSEIEEDRVTPTSDDVNPQNNHSPSGDSSSDQVSIDSADVRSRRSSLSANQAAELLLSDDEDESPKGNDQRPASVYDRSPGGGNRSTTVASRPGSRSSTFSAKSSSPARSMVNGDANEREPSESPEEDAAFETLDFRNATRETASATSVTVNSPARSRASYDYDNELRNTDSNVTLYSCNSGVTSPKASSPRRFITEDPPCKDTEEDSDETPPLPIGFDNRTESSDETDDVGIKPQPSRLPTPVELPRKQFKVSPCKMRPQAHCCRAVSVHPNRHYDGKHPEKSSKQVQQCFTQLESKDWEVMLKGLRTLSQIARDEPEQLDVCAPGQLARVLGKHVKNLRSQVARVACSAAGEVFSAHIRGIDQDLDEIAGPLLHRTADTNKFLREDCNAALDCMIEHFPPHRTIMTIANRGASHQNTIVHATTARLLYLIVSEIGPEHVMMLPKDVKDKLFATTAKLLTDGHLQARKHAKETFRLLSHMDGFRKSLTDAVPESTLRLIDKTLRTL